MDSLPFLETPNVHITHHPFSVALQTFRVQALDRHCDTRARLCRCCAVLLYPPFENIPKPTFPEDAIRPEVPSGRFELLEGELKQLAGIVSLRCYILGRFYREVGFIS